MSKRAGGAPCSYCGQAPAQALGLCARCYNRQRSSGQLALQRPATRAVVPPSTCWHCERLAKPLTHGLCHRCYEYVRKTKKLPTLGERTEAPVLATPEDYFFRILADPEEPWLPRRCGPPGPRNAQVRALLSVLPERSREMLILRCGLDGGGMRTLRQIAAQYGLSAQRCAQITLSAMRALRGDFLTADPPVHTSRYGRLLGQLGSLRAHLAHERDQARARADPQDLALCSALALLDRILAQHERSSSA